MCQVSGQLANTTIRVESTRQNDWWKSEVCNFSNCDFR